jgi:hypothetical protein
MQIQFPPNIVSVKRWQAFKAILPPGSKVAHRVIVIYKRESMIDYFYVTSQIEKACKAAKYDIGSIAKIRVSDWDVLTKESCIQCNNENLYEFNEDDFRNACASGEFERLGDVPEKVKSAIIHAICASESFTEADKVAYTT